MTFPLISEFPPDGDPAFNAKAHACMDSLRLASVQAGPSFAQLDASVLAVQAGLVATRWVSGTTYPLDARVYSPVNWGLYLRKVAGAGTTDPSADPTNWQPLTYPGLPVVTVSGTSQVAYFGAHFVMSNAAKSTLTLPLSGNAKDELWVTWANTRADNEYDPNGLKALGQSGIVTEDSVGVSVRIVYTGAAYGYAFFGA